MKNLILLLIPLLLLTSCSIDWNDEKNSIKYSNQSDIEFGSGNLNNALDLINKAIELNKTNADLYIQKGDILAQMGNKEIAYSFYLKGLEINPNDIDGYGGLGNISFSNGKYTEAIAHYQMALKINPNNTFYILQKGISIMKLGESQKEKIAFEVAIDEFNKCITLNSNFWEAYYFKGIAFMGLNKELEASEMFAKVLEIDQNNIDAKKMKEIADKKISEIFKSLR